MRENPRPDPPLAVLTTAVLHARTVPHQGTLPTEMRLGPGLMALMVRTRDLGDDLVCGVPAILDDTLATHDYRITVTHDPPEEGGFTGSRPTRRWGVRAAFDRLRWRTGW